MALNMILGPSGSGKTHTLFTYALSEAKKNPDINYLVVVPEQYTLSTQRELVRLSDTKGILNVDVLSFDRLSYRIFEEVGFGDMASVIMDDMGKNLILRHLANENQDKLSVLSGNMKKLGYITEIKSIISEFKQYRISDNEIDEMIKAAKESSKNILYNKLADIKVIYDSFNSYIKDKYTTSEEIIDLASKKVFESEKIKKSVVMFDGYTGFTPVQYGLINSLLQISRDIYVTILNDCRDNTLYNTEHELFYMSFEMENKLKRIAERNNVEIRRKELNNLVPKRYDYNKKRLIHLEKNLFREYQKPFDILNDEKISCIEAYKTSDVMKQPTKVVNEEIRVISALTPIEEVRNTAVLIKKLVMEEGYRYKDIAVVTGSIDEYAPVIIREFRKYNIPVFTDKKSPVVLNPFTEFIRSLIEIITSKWSYEAVFRYLRSGIGDYETRDIDELENFVLKNGIAGYSMWHCDWIKKYSRLHKKSEESENSLLNNIENVRRKITDELSKLDNLITHDDEKDSKIQTKSVNEYNAEFYAILEEMGVREKLDLLSENNKKTDEIFVANRSNEFNKVFDETISLMKKMDELLGDEFITIEEYGELLDAGFDEIRIGIIPSVTDYVQVGDITRSRFSGIHALFIVGANDGVIPKNNSGGGIISDIEKEFLLERTGDIELSPSTRMKSYSERLYLYMLMTKPDRKLFISFSRLNFASESSKPSYIVKYILDMFKDIPLERDFLKTEDYVYNDVTALNVLSENLLQNETVDKLLSYLYSNNELKPTIEMVLNSYMNTDIFSGSDRISKAVANVLYTTALKGTVTRLEKFAECSYQYFLEYGLSLKEREIFDLEAKDMGTLFHDSLEKYSRILAEKKVNWTDIDENERNEIMNQAIEEALNSGNYDVMYSTFRRKYVINRVGRILRRSISVLTKHLEVGKFTPLDAEVEFSSMSNLKAFNLMLSETERMHLKGKIDRIDTYEDEEHVYIKIIDYKSGSKSFDLVEIYKGLSLQLVVYLNAASELISKKTEKEVVPAGILYYHADDPVVDKDNGETDEEIAEKIYSNLKMKGLVNSDENVYRLMDESFDKKSDVIPVSLKKDGDFSSNSSVASNEEFKIISDFVNKKMCEIGRDILSGNIEAKPRSKKGIDDKKCSYCKYTTVCRFKNKNRFDESMSDSDDSFASVSYKKDEIIGLMKEELEKN